MSFELGHRFIQNWKQLPGYERNQLIGELSDLVILLSSDELPIKPKQAAAISETQESLFEDLPDNSAWLAPAPPKLDAEFKQHANPSQPLSSIQPSEPDEVISGDQSTHLDLDTEIQPHLINLATLSLRQQDDEPAFEIDSDVVTQVMPKIADLEAIKWEDEADKRQIDETFFETTNPAGALRVQVEQILDQWWASERERLVEQVLKNIQTTTE